MVDGFFLGGFAQGMMDRQKIGLDERKTALAERQVGIDERFKSRELSLKEADNAQSARRDLMSKLDADLKAVIGQINETAKAGREAGRTPEEIEVMVAPLAKSVAGTYAQVGLDPKLTLDRIGLIIKTPASPETELGKLQVDYAHGLVDEKTYTDRVSKLTTPESGPSIVEVVRRKIAAGDELTPGERQVYDDALKANPLARLLNNPQGVPSTPAPAPNRSQSSGTETPPVAGARKATDGQWYFPDPDRPGKYLKVAP